MSVNFHVNKFKYLHISLWNIHVLWFVVAIKLSIWSLSFHKVSIPFKVISKFEHIHNTRECLAYILRCICKGLETWLWHTGGTGHHWRLCRSMCLVTQKREGTNFSLKQITTNIYFEKQTQAVNLHFDWRGDESRRSPLLMAMSGPKGLLVIEKQIVCVHCWIHRDESSGGEAEVKHVPT